MLTQSDPECRKEQRQKSIVQTGAEISTMGSVWVMFVMSSYTSVGATGLKI